jgi:hypothetical protein
MKPVIHEAAIKLRATFFTKNQESGSKMVAQEEEP